MSKSEWGLKRICPGCGMRYYDMKKNPPVCPKCKTAFDPEGLVRARRGKVMDKKAAPKDTEDTIEDLPITDIAPDDEVMEDAEELADEDVDDVVEVEAEDEV